MYIKYKPSMTCDTKNIITLECRYIYFFSRLAVCPSTSGLYVSVLITFKCFLYVDFTMLDEQRIMDSEDEFEILM